MKKKILISALVILIIGGIGIIIGKSFFNKDFTELNDIIWARFNSDSDGYMNGGDLFIFNVATKEKKNIGNIALDRMSYDGNNCLIGIQNLYPNSSGYKGIITYDIHTKEIKEILECDRIYDMLGDSAHLFSGNVQMSPQRDIFYFLCSGRLFRYKVKEDELEILFETSSYQITLSSDGERLYFSENGKLYLYNLYNGEKTLILEGAANFAISNDEKMFVYENREKDKLYLYIPETKVNKEILQLNLPGSQLYFSDDNKYLLFTDRKESFVPSNYKKIIGIYDFENQKKTIVYKGNYNEYISNVVW